MANIGSFDARTVEPNSSPDPVPAGWYTVVMVQSEVKPTRSQDGAYLECGFRIAEGPHAGRMVYDRLNLHNPNPTAVEIAYRTLSAICHATGVMQVNDSQQLHNIPLQAKVTVRPATDQYAASNDIKGYRSVAEGQKAAQSAPAANAFAPPAAGNGAPSFTPPSAAPAATPGPFTPPGANNAPQQNPAFSPPAFTPPAGGAPPAFTPPAAPAPQVPPAVGQNPAPPEQSQPTPWGGGAPAAPAQGSEDITPPWARG